MKVTTRRINVAALIFGLFPLQLSAQSFDWVQPALRQFNEDSRTFMSTAPTIVGLPDGMSRELSVTEYNARQELRAKAFQAALTSSTDTSQSEPNSSDNVRNLVDTESYAFLNRVEAIAVAGLHQAKIAPKIWSGDYWAMARGGIGFRYMDESFPQSYNWQNGYDYYMAHPRQSLVANNQIHLLSPAEKYDLLVGASDQYGLAAYEWNVGKKVNQAYGGVEAWFGICHGWAPAAYRTPRPTRAITLISADGKRQIEFTIDDVKALFSFWWSKSNFAMRLIGDRCNSANPQTDPETGRIIEENCNNTNPATWHLSIVNQLGISQKSFIMDASHDRQVWNQPVLSYTFTYFNPVNQEVSTDWKQAMVMRSNFTTDKFRKFRSQRTHAMLGIAMEVSYVAENAAGSGSGEDEIRTVRYLYDLELDQQGAIIGGEWYQNMHPDFLWNPVSNSRPYIQFDSWVNVGWNSSYALPGNWQHAGQQAAYNGYVLGPIMDRLATLMQQ